MKGTFTLALTLAGALAAASCGGGGGSSTASTTPTSPTTGAGTGTGSASTLTVQITGQGGTSAFTPNPAQVNAGQVVVFKNNDTVTHHIVMDDNSATTGDLLPGATSTTLSIGTGGTTYHCTIHPGMVGGFNGAVAEPPPDCHTAYCFGGGD